MLLYSAPTDTQAEFSVGRSSPSLLIRAEGWTPMEAQVRLRMPFYFGFYEKDDLLYILYRFHGGRWARTPYHRIEEEARRPVELGLLGPESRGSLQVTLLEQERVLALQPFRLEARLSQALWMAVLMQRPVAGLAERRRAIEAALTPEEMAGEGMVCLC